MVAILSQPQCIDVKTSSIELLLQHTSMCKPAAKQNDKFFEKENWQMKKLTYMQCSYFKARNSISAKQYTLQIQVYAAHDKNRLIYFVMLLVYFGKWW